MSKCGLCPHACGGRAGGLCRVRSVPAASAGVSGGRPRSGLGTVDFYYGHVTALAVDPVEKKPLYHWRPGSSVFSAGFAGCNLHCPFCQNWRISQIAGVPDGMPEFPRISPAGLVNKAAESGCGQIAYTYSEPLVHFEYLLDCMEQARGAGIANILVSNGCVNEEPAAEILALTDAVNVDLKSFSADTYAKVLGGDLETVLRFIRAAAALGVHLEITTLVVPGLNDGEDEIDAAAAFVAGLSAGSGSGSASDKTPVIPWHLSAYHPDWKWHAPPAKPGVLLQTARRIRDRYPGLRNRVYIGNSEAPAEQTSGQAVEFWDTVCSACGAVLVRRGHGRSFLSGKNPLPALELRNSADGPRYYCAACGNPAPIFAAKGTPAVNNNA